MSLMPGWYQTSKPLQFKAIEEFATNREWVTYLVLRSASKAKRRYRLELFWWRLACRIALNHFGSVMYLGAYTNDPRSRMEDARPRMLRTA
jgi:hypothetical protein